MAGFRFVLALVMTLTFTHMGLSQSSKPRKASKSVETQADKHGMICKIYPLGEMGDDAGLGQWIADTIPQVIASGSWSLPGYPPPLRNPTWMPPLPGYPPLPGTYQRLDAPPPGVQSHSSYYQPVSTDSKATLAYYAPAKVLVINHTATVHGQVEAFLKDLKKALPPPGVSRPLAPPPIAPVQYIAPARVPESVAYNKATGYPVPAPLVQPKHLFHLIIRYEGDGIVDANVSDFVKAISGTGSLSTESRDKPKAEPRKDALSQLFNFIIRYEGDGVVDANVVEMVKALTAEKKREAAAPESAPPNAPFPMREPMGASTGHLPSTSGTSARPMPPAESEPQPIAPPRLPRLSDFPTNPR